MQIIDILTDLSRAQHELIALDLAPARLHPCNRVLKELTQTVQEVLTVAWIPRSLHRIHAAILGTIQNIEEVEAWIVEVGGVVLLGKVPEQLWRLSIAVISLGTLRFQLNVLFEAAAILIEPSKLSEVN